MPLTDEGMKAKLETLPKDAQGVVQSLYQSLQQAQQQIQQLTMEQKYRMGVASMQEKAETEREQMRLGVKVKDTDTRAQTAREDALTKAHTSLVDTHTKAHASIAVAEIGAAGQMLNTHVEAMHNKEAAREELKAAQAAEKSE